MRTTFSSAVALALVWGLQAFAQTSAGVKGVVTDSSGALVPGAEYFEIEGAGHLPGFQKPEIFANRLRDFVRK